MGTGVLSISIFPMKKTDILTWILNLHLIIIILNFFKYGSDNYVFMCFLSVSTAFNFWFYYNVHKKEKLDELQSMYDKTDEVKGQWDLK